MVCFDATTLWHFDAAEWAPSTASKADLTDPKSDFRFTPESGLNSDIAPCPKSANSGLMHRSKRHRYSITASAQASNAPFRAGCSEERSDEAIQTCFTARGSGLLRRYAPRNDAHSGMPAIRNACASLSMSSDRRKGARAFDTEIRWVGSIRIATAQACRAWSIRPAMA